MFKLSIVVAVALVALGASAMQLPPSMNQVLPSIKEVGPNYRALDDFVENFRTDQTEEIFGEIKKEVEGGNKDPAFLQVASLANSACTQDKIDAYEQFVKDVGAEAVRSFNQYISYESEFTTSLRPVQKFAVLLNSLRAKKCAPVYTSQLESIKMEKNTAIFVETLAAGAKRQCVDSNGDYPRPGQSGEDKFIECIRSVIHHDESNVLTAALKNMDYKDKPTKDEHVANIFVKTGKSHCISWIHSHKDVISLVQADGLVNERVYGGNGVCLQKSVQYNICKAFMELDNEDMVLAVVKHGKLGSKLKKLFN